MTRRTREPSMRWVDPLRLELLRAGRAMRANPALVAAAAIAGFLVAFSAASPVLFTAAAGSSAFRDEIATITPLGGGLDVTRAGRESDPRAKPLIARHRSAARALGKAVGASALVAPVISTFNSPAVEAERGGRSIEIVLMARTGATEHVTRLAGDGDGIWIADTVAGYLHVRPGDRISVRGGIADAPRPPRDVRVGAVYRALWKRTSNDYWSNFSTRIYPSRRGDPPALPTFAFLPLPRLVPLDLAIGGSYFEEAWEVPLRMHHMTLRRARSLSKRFAFAQQEATRPGAALNESLGCAGQMFTRPRCAATSSLVPAIELADRSSSAVAGPAILLGVVGSAVALGVAAAIGLFLVSRRRSEMRCRFARGESALEFSVRTALEVTPALLAGGVAGLLAVAALVRVVEPHSSVDGVTVAEAGLAAALALLLAALLLLGGGAIAFARLYRLPHPAKSRLARAPWELVPAAAGVVLLVFLRMRGASGSSTLAALAIPLLILAGAGPLLFRVVHGALARTSPRALAPYLAVRRVGASAALAAGLTMLAAVSLGVLFYAATVRASLVDATAAKAIIAVGGDVQGTVGPDQPLPHLPFPATKVIVAYSGANVGNSSGDQVDLVAVEPRTLAEAIHWSPGWGPRPARFLPLLSARPGAPVPVAVAGSAEAMRGSRAIWVAGERIPVRVVARLHAFPSMSRDRPLLIVSRAALAQSDQGAFRDLTSAAFAYVWARGPVGALERGLGSPLVGADFLFTRSDVLHNRQVEAARRSYGFLIVLGAASSALALVGLVLYLYARQRSQVLASALLRRMGLGGRGELLSLFLELLTILAAAAVIAAALGLATAGLVIASLDPLPQYPPAPTFSLPWALLVGIPALLLVVALVAAALTTRASQRGDVTAELRGV